MTFYLGTHQPHWLAELAVPLFVSRLRLAPRRTFPRARERWALDSGGFSELRYKHTWTITPSEYVAEVRRYRDEIGNMDWAASMDWMCEPDIRTRTGLSVNEHQRRTVDNYLALRDIAPEIPFVPVLQGWDLSDYLRCADLYERAGIDLTGLPLVGLGSVCRRQHTVEIEGVVRAFAGLSLHGFGVKLAGLERFAECLASADSLAWSFGARYRQPLAGCSHTTCANCPVYALKWRDHVEMTIERRLECPVKQLSYCPVDWTVPPQPQSRATRGTSCMPCRSTTASATAANSTQLAFSLDT